MTCVLAVHLPMYVSVVLALTVYGWAAWYWQRLGRDDVPESRRRVRRASLLVILLLLPFLVAGLSFIDPQRAPTAYVMTWVGSFLLVLALVVTALLDIANTMRLIQHSEQEAMQRSWKELQQAAGRVREERSEKSVHDDKSGGGGDRDESLGSDVSRNQRSETDFP